MLKFKDDIQCAVNSSEVATALFADRSKAFDTIRYDILLKKLNELVFSSLFIHLINSYLTERYQFVQIEDKKSVLPQVMCGVPQGRLLGPILFDLCVIVICYMLYVTCQDLHQVRVFNLLTVLPCIKDAKLKIYLSVLTLFKTMQNI